MLIEKMAELKHRLIEYATLVEGMINKSIKGLLEKDENLLEDVIEREEPKANNYDREIDETCTALIAPFEPLAKALRMVVMILKMNKDLERVADHAVNISESGLFLIARPLVKPLDDIRDMAKTASLMLKDSIDAFVHENAALARDVCDRDEIVEFRRRHGDIILKPLFGNGGAGVFRLRPDDENLNALLEMFTTLYREPIIVQRYLPVAASEAEIAKVVDAVIAETGAQGKAAMGRVIKEAVARLGGRAEGGAVSKVVAARLQ